MDASTQNTYVPVYNSIPEEWEEAREMLIETLRTMANGVNFRDVGTYYEQEVLAGQRFVPTSTQTQPRSVFRKVIDVGALDDFSAAPPSTQTVAHGITINANTRFTRIYGTANDPSTTFIPLPYSDADLIDNNIELWVDATNINIRSSVDYSGFTSTFVVLEYVQQE